MSRTVLLTPDDITASCQMMVDAMHDLIPVEIDRRLVTEWAEENRVLPRDLTPYPGPFSFDLIPYMREIADAMSESSPVREVAVMKGTQIAATVGLGENWIGYKIAVAPSPMIYVSGDAQMAETQMELRIDAMINSSGLAHMISSQHKRTGQRKTGDVKTRKEFPGGFLMAAGPNSGAKLRSMSFKDGYVDELDGFRSTTVGKEGNVIDLIRRRFDAFSETYKILWTSTPAIDQTSLIKRLWLDGDQRRYFVPCKHCGHMQYLRWAQIKFEHDDEHRLICEIDKDGRITSSSVRYECEECGGLWSNSDKDDFLPRGEWRPTAVPRQPDMRSYHVPGLLSPVGFRPWEKGVMQFLGIINDGKPIDEFQNWHNTFLGEPFVDEHERPRIEAILSRTRDYHLYQLPETAKPLIITLGADVQGDRIECEIVAWSKDKESWSVAYEVLKGDTADVDDDCWQDLRETITAEYAGLPVVLAGIDAGYRTDVVYEFCDSFETGVHPVMGSDALSRDRQYIKLYAVSGRSTPRIDINTGILKQEIYRYLNRKEIDNETQRAGYCHWPIEYRQKYFHQLIAEDRYKDVSGKWKWDARGRRNEALDCRVYALAMVYAYREAMLQAFNVDDFPWPDFWEYLIEQGGAQ